LTVSFLMPSGMSTRRTNWRWTASSEMSQKSE
jgi:hypothetical protein